MGKVARIALQGVNRRLFSGLPLFFLVFTAMSGSPAIAADDSVACRSPIARVVSIQGTIEVSRSDSAATWARISRLDTTLCPGDRLRTGAQSRGALFVQPETLVRIDQSTTIVLGANPDEPVFEFIQNDVIPVSAGDHACGAGYFVTRFPQKLRVRTPHFDAAVEGTEFLVALRCETTDLSVIEGKVLASSSGAISFPSQSVVSGQTLTVGSGTPPAIKVLLKPADAVQWTLYYPPLTPVGTVVPEDCRTVPVDNRASCLIAQAEQFLRAGQADEAQAHIADALSGAPESSDAKALSSIISLVKNDKAEALRLAKEAVDENASSAPAWLALSYAQQADFKLEAALTSAQKSVELDSNALTLSRVAELQLSLGWLREAEKTAKKAVEANPTESRAQMILGFSHLAQINTKAAKEDFGRAIELDSTDPLSRLGLGLAMIRRGKLAEGREQIEIAVALDPTNSLVRSYVGKAYYEENDKERDKLASTQFGLAKQFDANDPTPWFYASQLDDSQTRPVDALRGLEKSIALNEGRAVYRSRLLLDQDLAARGASEARTYNELGFSKLGMTVATESLQTDPAGASSHRFVADIYATLPRHEIARASELLQAQLRQPLGAPGLQAQLANDVLFSNAFFGPNSVGLNEFNPLFVRGGTGLELYGLYGDPKTYGDQIVVSGLYDPISVSFSQFSAYDSGYRPNNDATSRQYDALLQAQVSYSTSIQFEATSGKNVSGDLQSTFDPSFFVNDLRNEGQLDTYRAGMRQTIDSRSDLLLSVIYEDRRDTGVTNDPFFPFTVDVKQTSKKVEGQYLNQFQQATAILGVSYFEGQGTLETIFPAVPFSNTIQLSSYHTNAYGYIYVNPQSGSPQFQLGVSYDRLQSDFGGQEKTNPKVGIRWHPNQTLTLRAAAFRVLKRSITSDQGLEPTQIAGFNQFFDDPNGTISEAAGGGMDVQISSSISTGVEYLHRELKSPFIDPDGNVAYRKGYEDGVAGYLYWLPSKRLSVSVQPRYQRIVGGQSFDEMELTELPLSARLFLPSGFWMGATVTSVRQRGLFDGPGGVVSPGSDEFTLVDALIAYRLPRRSGTVSVQANNLFDKHFQFQEIDHVAPRYVPGRRVLLRASLFF